MRIKKHLSFLVITAGIAAAAIVLGVFSGGGGVSVTNAAPGDPGTATLQIAAPGAAQPLSVAFNVPVNLSQFTPSAISPTWAGYDFELQYDGAVLQANSDAQGICTTWGNNALAPHVVSGCAFQASTATGTVETINFTCLQNGTSQLTMLPRNDPGLVSLGTALFDGNGVDFAMTFTNGSVTCGNAPTATFTNTATATNTPAATSTFTPTGTATNTALPTNTPTGPQQTSTAQASGTLAAQTATYQADINVTPATFTPTPLGSPEPTGTAGAGTPGAGNTPPSGVGPGTGPGGAPGGTIRLPDTGSGPQSSDGDGLLALWVILAALTGMVSLGGAMYVTTSRRVH